MALTVDQHFGTFCDALADAGLHALVLLPRHHRSNRVLGIGRIADCNCAHGIPQGLLRRIQPAPRHEKPRSSRAGLTAIHERDCKCHGDRLFERGIVEHDGGRLSPVIAVSPSIGYAKIPY